MYSQVPAPAHPTVIMIIDDSPADIQALSEILAGPEYSLRTIPNAELALKIARVDPPDLIFLNLEMLEMSGLHTYEQIKASEKLRDIPVIFVNALAGTPQKAKVLESAMPDYLSRPFNADDVRARVKAHLMMRNMHGEAAEAEAKEISETQVAMIYAMANLSEARDNNPGKHLERVQAYARQLAKAAAGHPRFKEEVTASFIEMVAMASPLHDIGKIGIPEAILLKPGPLDEREFAIVKKHTIIGYEALDTVRRAHPKNAFINMACVIARSHHEKWNGSGYPDGLSGEEIPLAARIMAIVDVYDALRSQRVYKAAFNHAESCKLMLECSETHFDPYLLAVFEQIHLDFKKTWEIIQETNPIQIVAAFQLMYHKV